MKNNNHNGLYKYSIKMQSKNCVFMTFKPSLEIVNYSPDGFNWGYNCSDSAQLALGILYSDHVSRWRDNWEMSEYEVREWLRAEEQKMYEVGRKPKKSQAFARVICHIAIKEGLVYRRTVQIGD